MKKTVKIFAATLILSGCVTSGNQRLTDEAAVAQVKEGMTQAQVRALVGEPSSVTTLGNGEVVWGYVMMNVKPNAASFVPVVGLFAGRADSQTSTLTVYFQADGTVKNTSRSRMKSQTSY